MRIIVFLNTINTTMNTEKVALMSLRIGEICYFFNVFTSLIVILLQCSNTPLILMSCISLFSITLFVKITEVGPEASPRFIASMSSLRKKALNIDGQIGFPFSLGLIIVNLFIDWSTFPNSGFQIKHLVTITLLFVSVLSGFLTGKTLRHRENQNPKLLS